MIWGGMPCIVTMQILVGIMCLGSSSQWTHALPCRHKSPVRLGLCNKSLLDQWSAVITLAVIVRIWRAYSAEEKHFPSLFILCSSAIMGQRFCDRCTKRHNTLREKWGSGGEEIPFLILEFTGSTERQGPFPIGGAIIYSLFNNGDIFTRYSWPEKLGIHDILPRHCFNYFQRNFRMYVDDLVANCGQAGWG